MTLFRLDIWETWISLIGLNLISKVLQFILLLVLIGMASKAANRGMKGDPDDAPGWNQKDNGGWNQPRGGQPRFNNVGGDDGDN